MPAITYIGHVGVYCDDLEKQKDFYTRVLGFRVTDPGPRGNGYFFSAQPGDEHHRCCSGRRPRRRQGAPAIVLPHRKRGEVREFYRRLEGRARTSTRRSPTATR